MVVHALQVANPIVVQNVQVAQANVKEVVIVDVKAIALTSVMVHVIWGAKVQTLLIVVV